MKETQAEDSFRRTQLMVAENSYYDVKQMLEENPFAVFYFDKGNKEEPFIKMTYNLNGRFIETFGRGFYDEAGKLALGLSEKETSQKENDDFNWNAL